jgi:hypothetical protein
MLGQALSHVGSDFVIGLILVSLIAALAWGVGRWFKGSRYHIAERVRPEAEPDYQIVAEALAAKERFSERRLDEAYRRFMDRWVA